MAEDDPDHGERAEAMDQLDVCQALGRARQVALAGELADGAQVAPEREADQKGPEQSARRLVGSRAGALAPIATILLLFDAAAAALRRPIERLEDRVDTCSPVKWFAQLVSC